MFHATFVMSAVCCLKEMEWNGMESRGQGRCDQQKKDGEELNKKQGIAGIRRSRKNLQR